MAPRTEMNRTVVARKAGVIEHRVLTSTEKEQETRTKEEAKKKEKVYRQVCLICWEKTDLLAIASCMHPICLKCTIRMRVLDGSKECPVCRADMETVSIVEAPKHSKDFCEAEKSVPCEAANEHGIRFSSRKGVAAYERCLQNHCFLCEEKRGFDIVFPSFELLRRHLEITHRHSFCLICVENVNSLVMDRPVYDKAQLEEHMRVKLPTEPSNDSSKDGLKGHPMCRFCREHKYDDEQLYRHMKRDHFSCSLCEADGGKHLFHRNAIDLGRHYSRSHHPCTEEECATAGIVFRTQLELMLHKSKEHTVGGRPMELASQMGFRISPQRNNWRGGRAQHHGTEGDDAPEESLVPQIVPSVQQQTSGLGSMQLRSRVGPSAHACASPQVSQESVVSGGGASQVTTTGGGAYVSAFPNLPLGSSQLGNPESSGPQWNSTARQVHPTTWRAPIHQTQPVLAEPTQPEEFPSLFSTRQQSTLATSAGSVWGSGRTSELLIESTRGKKKGASKPDNKPKKSGKPKRERDLVWR